jgi:hypothetical protein
MFAAAVKPIIIMGAILEVAKVSVTVWLHQYWHKSRFLMKLYLVPAVLMLMVITSMGVFGFLSKAHLDQGIPSDDIAAKVSILDEKIKTEKDNIEMARKALAQMDASVDQTLARTTDDKGANRAVSIRKSQAKERITLQKDIDDSQAKISNLNEERAPIASQYRKAEAEVGPLKYVAALIYGDNPNATLLERAVRWVIIILVTVFDPLAIMLVLASNESIKWERESRKSRNELSENTESEPEVSGEDGECPKCGSLLYNAPGIGPYCPNYDCDVIDNINNWDQPKQEIRMKSIFENALDSVDEKMEEDDGLPKIGSTIVVPGIGNNKPE